MNLNDILHYFSDTYPSVL